MRIGAGRFKGRQLPPSRGARPVPGRLKTSLFSVLARHLEGARVLDVCAGVGGLGLEALSRGAAQVTLMERDRGAAQALVQWLDRVGAGESGRVLAVDALSAPWPPGPFDLVFVDPPFEFWADGRGSRLVACAERVLANAGWVAVKCPAARSRLPAPLGDGALPPGPRPGLLLPDDSELVPVREAAQGKVAYVLLARRARDPAGPSNPVKSP